MAKYDAQFKLKLVQEYLKGHSGYHGIAIKYGVAFKAVRLWVKLYQQHGQEGLTPKYANYSAQFKRQVLQHMHSEQLSCIQVATLFNIRNPYSIRVWQNLFEAGGEQALAPRPKGRAAAMRKVTKPDDRATSEKTLQELQRENEYLRAEVAYLKKLREILDQQEATQAKPKRSAR